MLFGICLAKLCVFSLWSSGPVCEGVAVYESWQGTWRRVRMLIQSGLDKCLHTHQHCVAGCPRRCQTQWCGERLQESYPCTIRKSWHTQRHTEGHRFKHEHAHKAALKKQPTRWLSSGCQPPHPHNHQQIRTHTLRGYNNITAPSKWPMFRLEQSPVFSKQLMFTLFISLYCLISTTR